MGHFKNMQEANSYMQKPNCATAARLVLATRQRVRDGSQGERFDVQRASELYTNLVFHLGRSAF